MAQQESKAAVGGIRGITNGHGGAGAKAGAGATAVPRSPSPAKQRKSAVIPMSPPPRTPESVSSTAVVESPSAGGGMVDRRQLFGGAGSGSGSGSMPPPPSTPKSRGRGGRRAQSKTPAKRGTPKDVKVMRQGGDGEGEGEEEGGESATPSKKKKTEAALEGPVRTLSMTPTKKKRGAFGRKDGTPMKARVDVPEEVSRVYAIVAKATGNIGGNGSDGAIYGELTVGGMQKVVNVLKEHTGFDEMSSFIDVGAGLGKPNFHVAQDPGVEISYGLELEVVRWELSIANHRMVLQDEGDNGVHVAKHNLFFARGDILGCETFDPFTHVYMFDIGFPPATLHEIAKKFNNSKARHLVSYQVPKKVIDVYGFDVDLVLQQPLSLTGSGEGHTMYLFRRKNVEPGLKIERIDEVDPFFAEGVKLCRNRGEGGGSELTAHVEGAFERNTSGGVRTRRSRRANA
ncbi:conserved unknown protein [Ectocarpus siliculosus]|uniref:DOT1 domain-containing protein n=1 Tax=Ectocarpus siliculosus TaxID=2880 RepID=D7FSQ9_ECTSI|nr:conserved unknown protein [Ectocarpus siliculosus]|eukprot:CBJ31200.1 conserved unknown protein [Ectocarpus siliculosus]